MRKSYIKYIVSVLLFGINGIVASHISLTSYQIVLLRISIGTLFLAIVFFASKQKLTFYKNMHDFYCIAASGVAMGASWMFLYEAFNRVGVGVATLIYYTGPVIVMVLSPLLFKEKLTWFKILGFVAVMFGMLFVNGVSGGSTDEWGIICGVLSACTYAVMVVANKKSQRVVGMENALLQLFTGFLTVAVFVGIKGGYAMRIEPSEIPWILVLGVLTTGIGCYFYFSSIDKLPVQTVAVCGYIEPLAAVVFSALFLKEILLPLEIVGAVLIIGGALFGECMSLRYKKV